MRESSRASGYAALAVAGTLWGTGFVFGKWALGELSVGHMILFRFVFACIGLVPVVVRERQHRSIAIAKRDVPLLLIAAVIGVPIQFLVQFEGLARTTVSHASLMVGILPVMLAAAAAVFTRERLDAIGWVALVASTVGAGLVAFAGGDTPGRSGPTILGDLLVVGSLVAATAWMLMSQRLMTRGYTATMTTAYVLGIGTVMLAAWVVAADGLPPIASLSVRAWLSVAAMGILATTITTLLWNWGLSKVPASRAGVFANLEPVVGAILGVALFSDAFGVSSIFGGALIVGAAVVMSRKQSAH